MFIFQCIQRFQSKNIEFTNAFAQADFSIGEPIFIDITRYFKSDGEQCEIVLRSKKIIYGIAKASHLWYEKLHNGLLECGFGVSKVDPCLFMSKNCFVWYMRMIVYFGHVQNLRLIMS